MAVYIKGVGAFPFGRSTRNVIEMAVEASSQAIEDSNRKPEFIMAGSMLAESLHGDANLAAKIADGLDLNNIYGLKVDTASSTGAALFQMGVEHMLSSGASSGLIVSSEKMSGIQTAEITAMLSQVLSPYERRHGATMPALAALVALNYMKKFGAPYESFAKVAIKNHENALLNPIAHLKKKITMEDILSSKIVSSPLRLYDCAPVSDGAVAIVITKEKSLVEVAGMGGSVDTLNLVERRTLDGFGATRVAAAMAYRNAGIRPADLSVAEIHDAFTPFEIIGMEDLGIAKLGEGWKMVMNGETAIDGRIPVNVSGGLKARGHPVSVSGLAQIAEIAMQLSGEAGKRQIGSAKIGLAQSIGGLASNNFVTVLRRV